MASRAPAEPAPAPRPAEPSHPARIQAALALSTPGDAAEREAVTTGRRVMAMRPVAVGPRAASVARAPAVPVPRPTAPAAVTQAPVATAVPPAIEASVRQASGGGAPLTADVRRFMEPRFRADFSRVRVHTDARAATLSTRLGARAFAYGRDIFFNAGQYAPDRPEGLELIAHELTHTVQQREAVQRDVDVTIRETTGPQVQRDGIGNPLDWIAGRVGAIPGFRMLTLVLGVNPVTMQAVERSAANILRALVEFLPGGTLITEALDRYGVFDSVGQWIEGQFRSLGMVGAAFRAAIDEFIGSLGVLDIFDPVGVWNRARRIVTDPVDRLLGFGRNLVGSILGFIRDAILRPLGALAANTRGYDLLRAVIGFDPVTGEAVPRSPEALIGGFMRLIGQEEVWENIRRSGAIPRAWAWFQGALGGLTGLVTSIPGRFRALLASLEITDLVIVTRALGKVAGAFASFVGDFVGWGTGTVINLLQIIVEVVAPGVMPYIRRAAGAFETILRDPVGFVRTLVSAAALGFRQFAGNFLTHLRTSLVGWLTGAMAGAGVYIPQGFTLREILRFALSVMGLTWANLRTKLVRATSETVVRALETGFDIVRTLVTEGPAAAWQQIVQGLTNLREMVIEQVMEFVRSRIVAAAVTRLLSLLTPAGAFIQAIIATYNTVMFFVERLRQIAQVAASFIDSLATIAAGTIAPAANRVERTMAGLLTLVIGFLARIAGLGRVSDAVVGIINRIRTPIDRALDRVVAWIVGQARRLGRLMTGADRRGGPTVADDRTPEVKRRDLHAAILAATLEARRPGVTRRTIGAALRRIKDQYRLRRLEPEPAGRDRWGIVGEINPRETSPPIPALMSEEEAVTAIRGHLAAARRGPAGSLSITVGSVAIGIGAARSVFRAQLLDSAPAGPSGAPAGSIAPVRGAPGVYTFEGSVGASASAVASFRQLKERMLLYHVDAQRFRVDEVAAWFEDERIRLRAVVQTHEADLATGRTVPGQDPNFAVDLANRALVEARTRLENLAALQANFVRMRSVYRDLEERGVLYGHQGLPVGHPHRTRPHINVEGRPYYVNENEMGPYIDITIYVVAP